MSRAARVGLICVSVAIFCYAGIGHVLGRTPDDKAYKSLTVFGEVLQKIQQDYVDEPNMHTVTAGSLHGLLESLDTQSSYLTPREYDEYKKKIQSSSTGDSGITLSKRFGYIIVISVLPDSAAAKAGIHSGDIFESIGGFTTRDMSVGQAMNLLTGPAGSGVKVAVIRRGKATPEEVDVVREKPAPVKITSQKAEPDTLALRLTSLDPGRADEVRGRLNGSRKAGHSQYHSGFTRMWPRSGFRGDFCGSTFCAVRYAGHFARADRLFTNFFRRTEAGSVEGPRFRLD